MDIRQQIEQGILVSPTSKKKLVINLEKLELLTLDGQECYQIIIDNQGQMVPILLAKPDLVRESDKSFQAMKKQYVIPKDSFLRRLFSTIKNYLRNDFRSKRAREAFAKIFVSGNDNPVFLSVGGGPERPRTQLTNLNIGPFPNVDVVANAHHLPYADNSIGGIYCEAVIEHLYDPGQAVKEMFRVLKPGGKFFSVIPFLQPYHGYPYHYQNYTLTGHQHLFQSNNFKVFDSGTCVGPMYAFVVLVKILISEYLPFILKYPLLAIWFIFGYIFLKPFDIILNKLPNAYVCASSTFLLGEK